MTKREYEAAVAQAELDGDKPPLMPESFDPEPRKHDLLSDEEYDAAVRKARAKVMEKKKDAAIAHLIEQETFRLQREEGLYMGDPARDEVVKVTVDLPEFAAYLSINGLQFWHGHTYEQPRHVANTLREMQQRTWDHQAEIDGKSRNAAYQRSAGTIMSMKSGAVQNAPELVA